jgi:YgiT-type zinc finger domain-containing protein
MNDWYCFKDKVKMQETDVKLSYMQMSQRIPGLKCPVCGECYLTEETVLTTVKDAEDMIYGK